MYGVLKIEEPSGPASILAGPHQATAMVRTTCSRLSPIAFPSTTPTGAALWSELFNATKGPRRLDAETQLDSLHICSCTVRLGPPKAPR